MDWRSIASGALAATTSVLGKYAFSSDSPIIVAFQSACISNFDEEFCWIPSLVLRGILIAVMISCNAVMLSMYLKAMHSVGSLNATVTNSAVNFLLSGLLGALLFGEAMSVMWFFGATLIITGISILAQNQKDSNKQKK